MITRMNYESGSGSEITGLGVVLIVIGVVVWLVFLISGIRIIQKAGYSGWWILITLVPVVNVVMYLVFAYSRWPVQRELDAWRAWAASQPRPPEQPPSSPRPPSPPQV
jgi:uncharacterized membrane protein YhaH (DUF805 family)